MNHGTKVFITNSGLACFFATAALQKCQVGLNAFIGNGNSPGLTLGSIEDMMGLQAGQVGESIFNNMKVPLENRLGAGNTGFLIAMRTLDMSWEPVPSKQPGRPLKPPWLCPGTKTVRPPYHRKPGHYLYADRQIPLERSTADLGFEGIHPPYSEADSKAFPDLICSII